MKSVIPFAIALVIALLPSGLTPVASADMPYVINYQGWLTTTDGTPLESGVYLVKFVIYDNSETELWSSDFLSVQVSIGLFDVQLGQAPMDALPDDLFATEEPRYLGITVGTDDEITPRTTITSASYSFHAIRADTATLANEVAQKGAMTGQGLVWDGSGWSPDNVGDITAVHADDGLTGGATDGEAHLSVGAGTGILVTSDVVQLETGYADGSAFDSRFVNENQSNSINSTMIIDGTIQLNDLGPNSVNSDKIVNGTIQFADIGSNGAAVGELMRWNDSIWEPAKQGFPAPDWRYPWVHLANNEVRILDHNLGGDPADYFVDLQTLRTNNEGLNAKFIGSEIYETGAGFETKGVYWTNLTTTQISIHRETGNYTADSIRVRIWIVEEYMED